ncbi:hypothetical protein ABW20_dc0100372 [Dactylellina cionopaga]|nr:hypothetical protein ABW20_dc0100372 [Dactylellina cionopaga]
MDVSSRLNADFETTLEDNDDEDFEPELGISNNDQINREKITAKEIGSTSFKATLTTVQYGVYNSEAACFLLFDLHFSFIPSTRTRYVYAHVDMEFTSCDNSKLTLSEPYKPEDDPAVAAVIPGELWGKVKESKEKTLWQFSIPALFQTPIGLQTGIEFEGGAEKETRRDHRMSVIASITGDDDHIRDNCLDWKISENKAQAYGIPFHLTTGAIITLPKGPLKTMMAKVTVKPKVSFSMNLLRLRSKKDDPIYLDGVTPKGNPVFQAGVDFKEQNIDWVKILNLTDEYQNRLVS